VRMLKGREMRMLVALVLGLFVSVAGTTAWAGAVLHLGNPPNSSTYLFGGEVQPISNLTLGILENGSGQPTLVNPLLLILGVPDDAAFVAPTITVSTGTGDIGGTANYFGGAWNTGTGFAGSFGSGEVYSFIGLTPVGNSSNNFGNWHDADLAVNGIDADFFGIYVYVLSNTAITGGATVTVNFASAIPDGTFAVGYGQDRKGHAFTTPFTESGMTTGVPEPGTALLLGTGLLGFVALRRKLHR